ncbi:MAG: hypothetical protein RIS41_1779, partial [Actinomycetota bacterium]
PWPTAQYQSDAMASMYSRPAESVTVDPCPATMVRKSVRVGLAKGWRKAETMDRTVVGEGSPGLPE